MDENQIISAIIHYLVRNAQDLKGSLPDSHYLIVCGRTLAGLKKENSYLVRGTVVDTIAELIEEEKFYGSYIQKSVEQASNPNNVRIIPILGRIKVPESINLELILHPRENEKLLEAEVQRKIQEKEYLDKLRNIRGFIESAKEVGLEKNIKYLAEKIYSNWAISDGF